MTTFLFYIKNNSLGETFIWLWRRNQMTIFNDYFLFLFLRKGNDNNCYKINKMYEHPLRPKRNVSPATSKMIKPQIVQNIFESSRKYYQREYWQIYHLFPSKWSKRASENTGSRKPWTIMAPARFFYFYFILTCMSHNSFVTMMLWHKLIPNKSNPHTK